MALVDTRGYQLMPNIPGALQAGTQLGVAASERERQEAIRGILSQQQQMQPQTEQQQMLAEQSAGFGTPQAIAEQPQPVMSQEEMKRRVRAIDPVQAESLFKKMGLDDATKRAEFSSFAAQLQAMPFDQRAGFIQARVEKLKSEGRDSAETEKLLTVDEKTQNQALLGIQLADLSTKERFAVQSNLKKALGETKSDVQSAKILEDGTVQFVRKDGTVEIKPPNEVDADIIARAKEFGVTLQQKRSQARGFGKDAAKKSTEAVDSLQAIRSNNSTLRQVIEEVRGGAETGPLSDRFPSFRSASVRLNQLKNKLGLDVVGAVTFGALSEGELKLALNTALPTNLDGPELIEWAEKKIAAQENLATYLEDQAIFLGTSGNSVSDWVKQQRDQAKTQPESPTTPQTAAPRFLGFE